MLCLLYDWYDEYQWYIHPSRNRFPPKLLFVVDPWAADRCCWGRAIHAKQPYVISEVNKLQAYVLQHCWALLELQTSPRTTAQEHFWASRKGVRCASDSVREANIGGAGSYLQTRILLSTFRSDNPHLKFPGSLYVRPDRPHCFWFVHTANFCYYLSEG